MVPDAKLSPSAQLLQHTAWLNWAAREKESIPAPGAFRHILLKPKLGTARPWLDLLWAGEGGQTATLSPLSSPPSKTTLAALLAPARPWVDWWHPGPCCPLLSASCGSDSLGRSRWCRKLLLVSLLGSGHPGGQWHLGSPWLLYGGHRHGPTKEKRQRQQTLQITCEKNPNTLVGFHTVTGR